MPVFPLSILRRRLLLATATSSALGWLPAIRHSRAATRHDHAKPVFFNEDEYEFIKAACDRLIPDGEDGTGALTAAVPFFIDRQLAGPYGQGDRRYAEPPWHEGTEEQGYQLEYTPAQLYQVAIADINDYCEQTYQRPFSELDHSEQDDLLHQIEDGDVELQHLSSDVFFRHLWQNTLEGFLSDPMYGGNRDFVGWKLIGFPGPRYNYVEEITQHGKPYDQPVVGLLGRDGTLIKEDLWP